MGLGSEVLGLGFEVLCLGFEVSGLGLEVLGLGFRGWQGVPPEGHFGSHLENLRLGFDVLGLGFGVVGLFSKVSILGLDVLKLVLEDFRPRGPSGTLARNP